MEASDLDSALRGILGQLGPGDCIKELHFRGHGTDGVQDVGDSVRYDDNKHINTGAAKWKDKLKDLMGKLCRGAVIHLWGCNVGAGTKGAAKAKEIADFFGVTVKAATDTLTAGGQTTYTGGITTANPKAPAPAPTTGGTGKAKKKKEVKTTEDTGCDGLMSTGDSGEGNGVSNTEDVGCDGRPMTKDFGEGDGLLNVPGFDELGFSQCPARISAVTASPAPAMPVRATAGSTSRTWTATAGSCSSRCTTSPRPPSRRAGGRDRDRVVFQPRDGRAPPSLPLSRFSRAGSASCSPAMKKETSRCPSVVSRPSCPSH